MNRIQPLSSLFILLLTTLPHPLLAHPTVNPDSPGSAYYTNSTTKYPVGQPDPLKQANYTLPLPPGGLFSICVYAEKDCRGFSPTCLPNLSPNKPAKFVGPEAIDTLEDDADVDIDANDAAAASAAMWMNFSSVMYFRELSPRLPGTNGTAGIKEYLDFSRFGGGGGNGGDGDEDEDEDGAGDYGPTYAGPPRNPDWDADEDEDEDGDGDGDGNGDPVCGAHVQTVEREADGDEFISGHFCRNLEAPAQCVQILTSD